MLRFSFKELAPRNKTQVKPQFAPPQIDDEWEKMYLDIEDNEQCQNIESIVGEVADKNDDELAEATIATNSLTQDRMRRDEWAEIYVSDNEDVNQYPRIDDDWEKMYLNDDGIFIDADRDANNLDDDGPDFYDDASTCCSFSCTDDNDLEEVNQMVNGEAYLKDLDDDHDYEGETSVMNQNFRLEMRKRTKIYLR